MVEQLTGHMPPDADIETILADPGGACPDCVRIVIEGLRAEVKRLRKELATVRREAHRDRLVANGAIDRIDQLAGERNQAEADVSRAEAERDAARVGMEKLRDLHRGVCVGACGLDDACECEERDLACAECAASWPCATIRALDGTEAGAHEQDGGTDG